MERGKANSRGWTTASKEQMVLTGPLLSTFLDKTERALISVSVMHAFHIGKGPVIVCDLDKFNAGPIAVRTDTKLCQS